MGEKGYMAVRKEGPGVHGVDQPGVPSLSKVRRPTHHPEDNRIDVRLGGLRDTDSQLFRFASAHLSAGTKMLGWTSDVDPWLGDSSG
jgi:hypothetical protein